MENQNIKYCQLCGKVAICYTGGGSVPRTAAPKTDNWNRFIAVRYCPKCGEKRKQENAAWRQRRFRERKRETVKDLRRVINRQTRALQKAESIIDEFEERTHALERRIRELEAADRDFYLAGRKDERTNLHGKLIGAVLNRIQPEKEF